MPPEIPPPISTDESPARRFSRRRGFIVGVILLALVGIMVIVSLLLGGKDDQQKAKPDSKPSVASDSFTFASDGRAMQYAGKAVYDSCNLLPVEIIKKEISGYEKALTTLGAEGYFKDAHTIEHHYIDRDIPGILGRDGQARRPQAVVSTGGVDKTVTLDSFTSVFDSNCSYYQGSKNFARVYVIQPPTPIAAELFDYLAKKPAEHQKKFNDAITMYAGEGVKDGPISAVAVDKNRGIAVILKAGGLALAEKGVEEIAKNLAKPPTGPLAVTYPKPYEKLKNACSLVTSSDFERLTGKPASALAYEKIALTETDDVSVQRSCERLEVDRFTNGVARITTTVRQWTSNDKAKEYLKKLTEGEDKKYYSGKAAAQVVGDEAYMLTGYRSYFYAMRIGSATIILETEPDTLPSSANESTYQALLTPIAKHVHEAYVKQAR